MCISETTKQQQKNWRQKNAQHKLALFPITVNDVFIIPFITLQITDV
jgi:hypothetical protein